MENECTYPLEIKCNSQAEKKKKAVSMEFTKKKSSSEVSSTYLSALKNTVGKGQKRCYKNPWGPDIQYVPI